MHIGLCYDTKYDYGIKAEMRDDSDFVSLKTVNEIKNALERCGYRVTLVGNVKKLLKQLMKLDESERYDLVFNVAEGFNSRNRKSLIPSLLEIYNIPFAGSDSYAVGLTLNKNHTKILAESIGIKVPKGFCFKEIDEKIMGQVNNLGYPIVVKPNIGGSSVGLAFVKNEREFTEKSSKIISMYKSEVVAEEFIDGKEITVPVVGNGKNAKALGVVRMTNLDGSDVKFYDISVKHENENQIINTLDTKLPYPVISKLKRQSVDIHNFLGMSDYSRSDFRVTRDGTPYFLEVNSMPSLSRGVSFEICGEKIGKEYHELVGMLVKTAIERYM